MANSINFLPISASILSVDGGVPTKFNVTNHSSKTLKIYWIDRSGTEILYGTIVRGEEYKMGQTSTTHAWVVKSDDGLIGFKFFPTLAGDIEVTNTAEVFTDYSEKLIQTDQGLWSTAQGWGLINVAKSLGVPDTGLALPISGQTNYLALNLIHAPSAWVAGLTGKGVTVAVVDSGIAANAEINTNLIGGYDFTDNDGDPTPTAGAYQDHSLGVAAIISASHSLHTGQDTMGVAPDAALLNVRVSGPTGATTAHMAAGIKYAVDKGAKVICMPLQNGGGVDVSVADAVHFAYTHNVVVVIIGGNYSNYGPTGPAQIALTSGECIDVGNYNSQSGVPFDSSNMSGQTSFPWVMASSSGWLPNSQGGYTFWSDGGTSFAGPYVAGLAALLFQQNPDASAKEIIAKIIKGAAVNSNALEIGTDFSDIFDITTANHTIDGGAGIDTVVWSLPSSNHQLKPTTTGWQVTNKTGLDGSSTLVNIERLNFTDRTVILDTQAHASYAGLPTEIYQFFITAFNAAPGVTYMDQLADAYRHGLSVKQIVDIFTTKSQFTNVYPTTLSNLDMATQLVNNIVKTSATDTVKSSAVTDIKAAMDRGWTVGQVIYQVFGNLAKMPLTDPSWGNTTKQFNNEISVAKYYTENLNQSTTDLETLKDVIQSVSGSTDVSTDAVVAQLIGVALLTGGLPA
jgi:subtilisin family serine protease